MKRSLARRQFLAGGSIAALAVLTACSGTSTGATGSGDKTADPNAKVTITVGDQPTADKKEELANFNARVAEFQKQNPNITIQASTETWQAQTFQAKLAAGTLPTVMGVSLTYSQALIAKKQLPNMTPYLKQLDMVKDLNPLALKNAQDAEGNIYTVPTGLFSVGMAYNRSIFTKAGLDPDKPPATWDEVRAAAKTISEKVPGVAGYAQLTTNNTGGWMLTTMTYSMGGRIVTEDGGKTAFGDATTQALQQLHDMRWVDNSMGSQFLYDQDQVRQNFSAGKIGMVLQAPDIYGQAIHNYGMKPADFGQTQLPQANGTDNGTLTGGTLKLFNVKATPDQLLAALKWIKYYEFDKYYNKDTAVELAKVDRASGQPVGIPNLPPVSKEVNDQYLEWIKSEIDVPLEQFAGYANSTLPLIPEPPKNGQQVYAALDPVVQKVLTDKNADIKGLLDTAAKTIDAQLARP